VILFDYQVPQLEISAHLPIVIVRMGRLQ